MSHSIYTPLPQDEHHDATALKRSILSDICLSWVGPFLKKGYANPLDASDLGKMPLSQQATHIASHGVHDLWTKRSANGDQTDPIRLHKWLFKLFGIRLIAMALLRTVVISISLALPFYFLPQVLQCLNPRPDGPTLLVSSAPALAGILCLMQVLQASLSNRLQLLALDMTVEVTATLADALYEKSLRLAPGGDFPPAKILTITSSDVSKLAMFLTTMVGLITAPAHIIVCSFLLSKLLGHVVWVPICLFLLFIGLQTPIGRGYGTAIWGYLEAMDARVQVVRELLYAIKMVKYRDNQARYIKYFCAVLFALTSAKHLQEVIIPVATFVVFASFGGSMSGSTPFAILGLFGTLNTPFTEIAEVATNLSPARVSLVRIEKVLNSPEISPAATPRRLPVDPSAPAVHLHNASFAYDPTSTAGFILQDLDLQIPAGSLTAVVGAVGAGKSSLLAALAGSGELSLTKGSASVAGSIAYCAQEPWILAGTIRENVHLKGEPSGDDAHLSQVITDCQLDYDVAMFSHGLDTYIGEKGVTLSGGQKARVALARAVYCSTDLIILDDPFQALDAKTNARIFDDLICGPALEQKTVVLATHQLHLLPRVDRIVVLEAGRVVQHGTFAELMQDGDGALASMLCDYKFDNEAELRRDQTKEKDVGCGNVAGDATQPMKSAPAPAAAAQTATEEERAKGAITVKTIWSYMRNAGGPVFVGIVVFCSILLAVSTTTSLLFVSWWASDAFSWPASRYVLSYGAVGAFSACTSLLLVGVIAAGSVRAACAFHDDAVHGLMRAPLAFFERQPIGRILSRLTVDVKDVDANFPLTFIDLFAAGCELLAALAVIASSSPTALLLFAALAVVYGVLFAYYQRSFRELKRLQSTMKSPLTAHIAETLANLPSIRAYGVQECFARICQEKIDDANLAVLYYNATRLWFLLRLSTLSASVVFAVVALAPLSKNSTTIGISVTAAITLSNVLINFFISLGRCEAMFSAVERLNHYSHELPSEAAYTFPNDPSPAVWPSAGAISINNLSLRYEVAQEGQLALNSLSLAIRGGEKIGICGRTGSGKSTLLSAFFRLMEPHAGGISIDGVDISTLGLQALRSAITMVAQDPTLFSGTVRSNLILRADAAHNSHATATDDTAIWAALDRVGLRKHVESLPAQLDAEIVEGGSNWSAGQRQLLCLARAVLSSSRIVVLDEASSSLDAASDAIIQRFVANDIPDTTVISVAHRLNSICGFDRVLVLDSGKIVEFGTPWELLGREQASDAGFAALVRATGPANEAMIHSSAKDAYDRKRA
ncbi:hypothetical protein HDU87_007103 [Geranomyces variabilis]|uniref:P-loop containing nucleoside triphosphate hydrolase protein n=1 Tax=Geranomyces variabilis TaxID=109894 RepID=A0AAD5TJW4_9FUNG|nr:hypothetical protein HDU87_007103 [Geranomyces variabilis]